jgi:eukaryotic-like serine/threonine-protein kinase
VPPQTLDSLLAREGSLSFDDLLPILENVLEALISLHATGAVHGALAPENVLVEDEEGKLRGALVEPAKARAAPSCRAPEQGDRSATIDSRADLFALGTITFRALTGRFPHAEGSSANAPSLSDATGEQWPTPLESWVSSLLQRDPRRRLPSAELALDALTVMSRRVAGTSRPPPQ